MIEGRVRGSVEVVYDQILVVAVSHGQGAAYLELVLSGLGLGSRVEKINGENLLRRNPIVSTGLWMPFGKIEINQVVS
jgi:hypothetical protein